MGIELCLHLIPAITHIVEGVCVFVSVVELSVVLFCLHKTNGFLNRVGKSIVFFNIINRADKFCVILMNLNIFL